MFDLNSTPLAGARIWLSGAIPTTLSSDNKEKIERFVEQFAAEVFKQGGSIIHGSHPTIRDLLLRQAEYFPVSPK